MGETYEHVRSSAGTNDGARWATQQYTIGPDLVHFPVVQVGMFVDESTVPVAARGDSTYGLDVDVTRVQGTVTISGTVTANAGTDLNTSALALEATQVDVRTALQIIDDWDEVDRAKVNVIVGQAGVAAGSGDVSASTQRVVLANAHGKTLKHAVVALTASGNIVGAAGVSKSIRVYGIFIQARNDGMIIQITDGNGGANLSARMAFNAREGMTRTISPPAWLWKTSNNTALYASISGTGTVDIDCQYWDDDPA